MREGMKNYEWLTVRTPRTVEQMRLWRDNPRLNPEFDYLTLQSFAEGICGDKGDRDAFIDLVESIVKFGFVPADPIVVWQNPDNEKFYVAEGNRRVLALKLLLEPHKAPASIRAKINTLSLGIDPEAFKKIKVAVAPTFEDAEWYIFQRHSTAGLQRKWSREQQFRSVAKIFAEVNFSTVDAQERTQLPLSEIQAIIRTLKLKDYCLQLGSEFSAQELDDLRSYQFPISTFERFMEDSDILEKMHIRYENENIYIDAEPEYFNASLVSLVKGIVSRSGDKISSRTSSDTVKERLPEIENKAEEWMLGDNVQFKVTSPVPKPSPSSLPKSLCDKNNPNRAKIIPRELILNSSNYRINGIWNELTRIPTGRYCNVSSAALRVFLDLTIKEFIEAQNLISDIEKKYKQNIRDINLKKRLEFLKDSSLLSQSMRGDIGKLLNSENDFSLDVLNGYVHSSKTYNLSSEFLNRFWDFLCPLFTHILDISDKSSNNNS